jgi:hypothetical protein
MLQPALLGGIFTGVLSALPFVSIGNCCCLWILGGGAIAAYLDQQNHPSLPITVGRGAMAGAAAGLVSAFVWLVVSMAIQSIMGPMMARVAEGFLSAARDIPPEARDIIEGIGQGGSPLGMAIGFFFMLCVGTIFSAIGGAIGATFFRNDVPPALGGPIPPPPLPPQ